VHAADKQWWKTHAADYVLGLLSNSERLVFERVLLVEPELQSFVIDWRQKLQPMSDALPPVQPPDHILPALITNLPLKSGNTTSRQSSPVSSGRSLPAYNAAQPGSATALVPAHGIGKSHYRQPASSFRYHHACRRLSHCRFDRQQTKRYRLVAKLCRAGYRCLFAFGQCGMDGV